MDTQTLFTNPRSHTFKTGPKDNSTLKREAIKYTTVPLFSKGGNPSDHEK